MSRFDITPLSPAFGAEVRWLSTTSTLDDESCRELRHLFDTYGVLVFRDLDLDRWYQQYLAELVDGQEDLSRETVAADAQRQSSFYISNKREGAAAPFGRLLFHCDGMWSEAPFRILSLYGEEVMPPVPGTTFASSKHAWDTLPDTLRVQIEGRAAVHVPGPESFAHRRRGVDKTGVLQPRREQDYSAEMPVAYQHPRTSQTLLYVTQQMTAEIVGLPTAESDALLDELFEHVYRDDNLWTHDWCQGDLVMWDNLAVQHARPDVRVEANIRTLRKVGWPLPANTQKQLIDAYQRLD